ncbi:DUF6122 family protein [Botryobacter ruber]|uniref:DUF6122 family protein n=1 Tax=Botryobacter ruber TaxID=2171629 RepID=UPI000E0C337A|nr:DUF6122 family protein [Botryobacter ruber]
MSAAFIVHMFLHVALPVAVAWMFYRDTFKRASLLMLAGILIDIDHLWAVPVLDPDRCSVGFHFLHSYWLAGVYVALALLPQTRLIGLGLVIHLVLDAADCARQGLW